MKQRNERKRILLVYYKLFKAGGVARVMTNLANELVEQGYEVSILLMVKNTDSFFNLDKRVKIESIDSFSHWGFQKINVNLNKYASRLPYKNNIKNYVYDFGQWQMLHKWMNKYHENYDLIISCWYKLSSQLATHKKVRNKTIAWEHANFQVGGVWWKGIMRRNYKKLKAIVCINTDSYNHYKLLNSSTWYIPNIIGLPFESYDSIQNPQKENTLIYVGRLDEDKNVEELLKILDNINFETFQFKIIGDGPSKNKIEKRIEENSHLKQHVQLLGLCSIEEIYKELSLSKIFLFTSKTECLPTVLIEANLCSNALIAYDCPYGPSDIINEKNGFLVPLHDQETFQQKLTYLIQNKEKLDHLMETSYQESKKWRKDAIIEQWKKIL